MIVQLQLDGMAAELARQSILVSQDAQTLTLSVDPQQMHAKTELALQRLEEQIKAQLGCRLVFVQADQAHLTPARYETEMKAQRQANAVNSIQSDPQVQSLIQTLNLKVIESSIRPVKH
jgi:DNA polymerase-3 subunit gamma/tau